MTKRSDKATSRKESLSPNDQLAARLRDAREYMGVNQEQVAKYLNLARSAISEIESGKRSVSAIELQSLAKLYQKSVSWFTDNVVANVPEDVEFLARTATQLSGNDRSELQKFAEFLKAKSEASDGKK